MADFQYEARNSAGESVKGVLEADDEATAIRQLDELELFPVDIRPTQSAAPAGSGPPRWYAAARPRVRASEEARERSGRRAESALASLGTWRMPWATFSAGCVAS